VLHRRLVWPAWAATAVVVLCVALGGTGLATVAAFGLAAFAGAAAVRQLVVSRSIVGRSNGGMVVHLGVIVVAVAFAAAQSYGHRAEFRLSPGESAELAGHRVTYLGSETRRYANRTAVEARVRVDGDRVFRPALNQFPFATQAIGTPSVRVGVREDVYLTLISPAAQPEGEVVLAVVVQPLVMWLWIGGGLMAVGTFLAALPLGRRRILVDDSPSKTPENVHQNNEEALVGP